jgi:hypothetical protein
MLKLTVAALAVVLAGTAAAGWRDLRIDGSSEAAFAKSLDEFKDKLSPAHGYVLGEALKDIWVEGEKQAAADQREYTDSDYYAQLDGLSYKEIVTLTDPTGDAAKDRYRVASLGQRYAGPAIPMQNGMGSSPSPPIGFSGQQVRGATQADMLPAGRAATGHPCGVGVC